MIQLLVILIAALTAPGLLAAQATSAGNQAFQRLLVQAQREGLQKREALLRRALAMAEKDANLRQQGIAWRMLGRVCLASGRYRCALQRYERAAMLFRRSNSFQLLAALNTEFGLLLYEHGKIAEAQQLLADAVARYRENKDSRMLSLTLPGLALTNAKLGHHAEALANIEEAGRPPMAPAGRAYADTLLGNVYVELGQYNKAIALITPVLNGPIDIPLFAYRGLAAAYYHTDRDKDLEQLVGRCLASTKPNAEESFSRHQSDCLYWRARSYYRRGNVDAALKDIKDGLAAVEAIRSELIDADLMKRDFDSSRRDIADLAMEILFAGQRYDDALQVAEQWRARAFLDLLASHGEDNNNRMAALRNRRLQRVLHLASEPVLTSRRSTDSASVADILRTAQRLHSTVVSYWTTPTAIYIWTVKPDGTVAGAVSPIATAGLEALLAQTQSLKAADRTAWRRLHDLLLTPVQAHLPKEPGALLTIVPHGPLLNLSFAALQDRSGKYLLERYAIHYTPAAALLDFTQRDSQAGPARVLAVGNPDKPSLADGKPLAALAGSKQELASIAAAMPAARVSRLEGAQALPAAVKTAASRHEILHFATHSVVNADEPFESFLALSDGQRLTAGQIYDLDTKPSLVVLSSCRSATGPVSADGVLGLTRAFFYAGAASIIASVWEVPDQTAPRLAASLYRSLERGQSKSVALRTAQLALLQSLRTGRVTAQTAAGPVALEEHPILWAGFLLQGEP